MSWLRRLPFERMALLTVTETHECRRYLRSSIDRRIASPSRSKRKVQRSTRSMGEKGPNRLSAPAQIERSQEQNGDLRAIDGIMGIYIGILVLMCRFICLLYGCMVDGKPCRHGGSNRNIRANDRSQSKDTDSNIAADRVRLDRPAQHAGPAA